MSPTPLNLFPIQPLKLEALHPLLSASLAEGYDFIQRLWDEYEAGLTTFSEPGAILLGMTRQNVLIAIGGVHPDPYLKAPHIGRIRHVYVVPSARRLGLGAQLVRGLISQSSGQFSLYTLRTLTDHGHAFYTELGFTTTPRFDHATHLLALTPDS